MQEKNIKKPKIVEISIFVTIVLFVFAITAIYNEKTVKTNTELLSNKKIGWGIKRNDNHEQPDVGSANKNVLEQYNGIALGNNEKKYIYSNIIIVRNNYNYSIKNNKYKSISYTYELC